MVLITRFQTPCVTCHGRWANEPCGGAQLDLRRAVGTARGGSLVDDERGARDVRGGKVRRVGGDASEKLMEKELCVEP
jgi:hypothetical protein